MRIWDRSKQSYVEEVEYEKEKLIFLYQTLLGRILLFLIFSRRWYSKLEANKQSSPRSLKLVDAFIDKYKVDMSPYDQSTFMCFRDFFLRKRAYEMITKDNELIAIADARLAVYSINEDLTLSIKKSIYTLQELIEDEKIIHEYAGGYCLIYRLAVEDYHRYVYLDEGQLISTKLIKGVLHTVRPISEKYHVFARNTRQWSVLQTKNYGNVIQIEIGALLVGKIVNYETKHFKKLQEKGYFDYGGSTVILLFKKDTVKIDQDILRHSLEGIETKVTIGEGIGSRC